MPAPAFPVGAALPHGRLTAREVGALVGVSGTTVGQWARRGSISSSHGDAEPRVYSVEDLAEAAIVAQLLARGMTHAAVRAARVHLGSYAPWPLSQARLATTRPGLPRIALREDAQWLVLGPRGWQAIADGLRIDELRVRFEREPAAG